MVGSVSLPVKLEAMGACTGFKLSIELEVMLLGVVGVVGALDNSACVLANWASLAASSLALYSSEKTDHCLSSIMTNAAMMA